MPGENENSIGTARAYLDIDVTDWDSAIARAKNSAAGLGTAAEAAFDNATAAQKRAATQLLTYVTGLDRTADQQKVLTALMKGVPVDIATAAAAAIEKQRAATTAAAEAQRQLNEAFDEASGINSARDALEQYIATLNKTTQVHPQIQSAIDAGVDSATIQRATAALSAYEQQQQQQAAVQQEINAAHSEAIAIDDAYSQQFASNAQQQINSLLGIQSAEERTRAAAANRAIASRFEVTPDDAFVRSLQRQYDYAGKTHFEILRMQAAERGLAEEAGPVIDKLEQQAIAMRNGTLTTKQYEFALRGLPAQFTDIFTSLAGGQNPFTVLLYQGGQIKDMFGGISAATKAVAGQVLKFLTNPFLLAAAAVAATGFAAYKGSQDLSRLEKAVIASGNAVGTSAAQLDATASAAGAMSHAYDDARAAVEGLAKAGVGGAGIGGLAVSVADVAKVTGQKVEDILADFKSLETKPAESVAKLNEQYNFLTGAQFAQINALEQVGRTRDAARMAEQLYTSAMRDRAKEVKDNSGWLVESAHWVRDEWNAAWNAIKGVGKEPGLQDRALALEAEIDAMSKNRTDRQGNLVRAANGAAIAAKQKELAAIRKQQVDAAFKANAEQLDAQKNRQSITAQQELAQFASPEDKYEQQVKLANERRYRALAGIVDPVERERINKQADAQIKQAKDARDSALKKGMGSPTDSVAQIKADAAAQQASIAAQTAFVQGQFQLRQISMEEYYAKLKQLAQQSGDIEVASLNNQITAERAHGASQEKILQLQNEIVTSRQKTATKEADIDRQEALAVQQRDDAIRAYKEGLDAQTLALQRNLDTMVNRVGMGQREFEIAQATNQVLNDQADKLNKIDQEYAKTRDQVKRDAERNAVLAETPVQLQKIHDSYDKLAEKQLDVTNGMKAAFKDFAQSAMQLSDNFSSVWTTGFASIGEAAARAATGVGSSLDDMAKQIEATAVRVLTNAAVAQFLKMLQANAGKGGFLGTLGSILTPNAKGGVYASSDLSSYSSSIVSKPTLFAFAKGAVGLMGEAGNEAIMPVSKDSNGVLGVRSYGGGSAGTVVNVSVVGAPSNPTVNSKPNSKGGVDIEVLFKQLDQGIASGIATGTSATSVAIKKRFGR